MIRSTISNVLGVAIVVLAPFGAYKVGYTRALDRPVSADFQKIVVPGLVEHCQPLITELYSPRLAFTAGVWAAACHQLALDYEESP